MVDSFNIMITKQICRDLDKTFLRSVIIYITKIYFICIIRALIHARCYPVCPGASGPTNFTLVPGDE